MKIYKTICFEGRITEKASEEIAKKKRRTVEEIKNA